jgi:hypothetical protein
MMPPNPGATSPHRIGQRGERGRTPRIPPDLRKRKPQETTSAGVKGLRRPGLLAPPCEGSASLYGLCPLSAGVCSPWPHAHPPVVTRNAMQVGRPGFLPVRIARDLALRSIIIVLAMLNLVQDLKEDERQGPLPLFR